MNKNIRTTINASELQNDATIPHIIKIQIIANIKNKFQLNSIDCRVERVL
jgi:hypothetical protein